MLVVCKAGRVKDPPLGDSCFRQSTTPVCFVRGKDDGCRAGGVVDGNQKLLIQTVPFVFGTQQDPSLLHLPIGLVIDILTNTYHNGHARHERIDRHDKDNEALVPAKNQKKRLARRVEGEQELVMSLHGRRE